MMIKTNDGKSIDKWLLDNYNKQQEQLDDESARCLFSCLGVVVLLSIATLLMLI